MSPLIPVSLVCYAVLALLRPRTALAFLLALLPTYLIRFTVSGVPFTVLEGMILLLVGAVLLRGAREARNMKREAGTRTRVISLHHTWTVLPVLWILAGTVAAIGSSAGIRAWGIWKAYMVEPVLLFWVMRWLALRGARIRNDAHDESRITNHGEQQERPPVLRDPCSLILALAVGALLVAVPAMLQALVPYGVPYPWSQPGQFRATSVFGYPNAVGLFLAPLIPVFLGAVASLRNRRGARTILESAIIASVVAIALTKGTGAIAATIVGVFVLTMLAFGRRWFARRACSFALVFVSVWVLASLALTVWLAHHPERPRMGPPLWQKLTFQQWSGSVRLSQYRETWELLRDHPIRGGGLAAYQDAIAPYHRKANVEIFTYPHNLFLAIWSEIGLLGLLVFLLIVIAFLRSSLAAGSRQLAAASTASLLAVLVFGLVDVPYFKNDLAVLFWVIVAIGLGAVHPCARGRRGGADHGILPSHREENEPS